MAAVKRQRSHSHSQISSKPAKFKFSGDSSISELLHAAAQHALGPLDPLCPPDPVDPVQSALESGTGDDAAGDDTGEATAAAKK